MVYTKVCLHCGAVFQSGSSHTSTVPGLVCEELRRAAKERDRVERIEERRQEVLASRRSNLLSQEFVSITDAATLIGVSRPTVYKMINDGRLESVKFGDRLIRVKVASILSPGMAGNNTTMPDRTEAVPSRDNLISKAEIISKYHISEAGFYKRMKAEGMESVIVNGRAHYPLNRIRRIYENKLLDNIKEWYTVDVLRSITGMEPGSIYDFCHTHSIPRKRQGRIVLISKADWDKAKGADAALLSEYYSVTEVMEKYNLSRGHVYAKAAENKIKKVRIGNYVYLNRKEVDKFFNKKQS